MIEVERKFRLIKEKEEYILKYLSQWDSPVKTRQTDKVFLLGCDSFQKFKPGDPVMRIRSVDDITTLTYKRKITKEGNTIEHELLVNSADIAQSILEGSGYVLVTCIEKNRSEYSSDRITVCLDNVIGLGIFLEIEILCNSENEMKTAEAEIMELASDMRLVESDLETKKYDELLSSKTA